ncbi:MAG: hypothetical protein LPK19_12820 [Hymenobacteraceae bacterium]|nr:hypothetical protein [Hymenobacteraceae bacterium]MDX5397104.1 hypothetical protein [Hymenobacteraceae bacterium]MDX5513182.1 hypothetical protein [Hymenobacteraceae bacterium]
MKKVLIGIAIFVVVLIAGLSLIPLLFKDKIKQVLDQEIAKNVRANVIYNADDVSISIFRDFPDLTLSINNLAVVGQDSFATDTLAYLPAFRMGLNLMSVISGDELKVNQIEMEEPVIKLIVLKSGLANWDIFITDTTDAPTDTVPSEFKMAIKGWEIDKGTLFYTDYSIPFAMRGYNVNHSGSGDFEKDVFDMESQTTSDRFTVVFDGVEYIKNAVLNADVTMAMDLNKFLYTFKENTVKINDFVFGFDGSILMPEEDIDMDLTFNAKETDFKNILSVVPGMYTEDFNKLNTSGKMAFNGYVKGRYNETSLPGFGTDLKITEGMFKYPDLPQAARNINVDMSIDNKDGNIDNTNIEIRQFHMDLGKNPIDAKAVIQGLEPMKVNGNLKANIDLAEMTKVFPVEGTTLRGLLKVDADAKGTYSETSMPVVQANLILNNGYIKSKDFPAPIEQLNVVANVVNTTGNTDDTNIRVEKFRMLLEDEPLEGRVYLQGIDQPVFDAAIKGTLDLTKLTKIFPQEGMTLTGKIKADIQTQGKMADVEAENYANIRSSGSMNVQNLTYVSTDLPNGMKVNSANATFNNEKIDVQNMSGYLGKSDVQMSGTISNYMGYMFSDNQPLRGVMNLNSKVFNVNEWMVDEATGKPAATGQQPAATTSAQPAPAQAEGVVEIPANLDFVLNATAGQVLYDNLKLENLRGKVIIKDQIARLQNVSFNTLGGSFITNGSYNTQNLSKPTFTFGLDIKNLGFKEAFAAFNTIQTIAPIARLLEGKFSTNFNLAGELGQDMMPLYSTLDGQGIVQVIRAAVTNVPIMNKISEITRINELKNLIIENKMIDAQVVNGALLVKPFDVNIGNMKMVVGGKNTPDGQIDYATAITVPSGKVGAALSSQLANVVGKEIKGAETVTLNLNIGGTVTDPKVSLAGGAVKEQAKGIVEDVVKSKVDEAKADLEARKKAAEDSVRAVIDQKKKAAQDSIQRELERKKQEAEQNLKKQAEDKLKGIFKR